MKKRLKEFGKYIYIENAVFLKTRVFILYNISKTYVFIQKNPTVKFLKIDSL